MAKLSVSIIATVNFFLISLALSHARIPLNLPANDVINHETQNPLPASDVTPTIHLPSEKASNDESHADTTNGESNTVSVTTVPIKFVRFRPINRHSFTLRSTFPLRRCRGHLHRHNFKPWGQRLEIPYGDDMIVSTGKNKDFDRVNLHGGVRQIPAEWVKLQRNHLHHYHHHHHDEDEMEEKATRREKNGQHDGLMKRFRKFLNQFQF